MTTEALIAAVDSADSPAALVEAVAALSAARTEAAIPTLIRVLGFNNPGAAVAAVRGLVQLGDVAVMPLLDRLDGYNYGARAWAIRALAEIGDPRSLEVLVAAAADFSLSVRRAAVRGLGFIEWDKLPPEAMAAAKGRSRQTLLAACDDPEWVVRYAAIVALEKLGKDVTLDGIRSRLETLATTDDTLAVRARAQVALD